MHGDPAFEITITKLGVTVPRCESRLRQAVETALRRHNTPSAAISVTLVDDACIARLNELYLGRKGPTDVLSFDLRDDFREPVARQRMKKGEPATRREDGHLEGEIVVSVDTAARESKTRGHSVVAELTLYVLHGALHLLGYSDRHKSEALRMHEVEDEILSAIGLGRVFRANPA